jgi:hypothetical protein
VTVAHENERVEIKISGRTSEQVAEAKKILEELVQNHCSSVTHPDRHFLRMEVPQKYHGRILGQRGLNIRRLEGKYDVKVYMPTILQTHLIVVGNDEDKVNDAMDAIEDIMDETDKKEAAVVAAEAKAEAEVSTLPAAEVVDATITEVPENTSQVSSSSGSDPMTEEKTENH